MSVSLNITITYDEIRIYTRFKYDKLIASIESLKYQSFEKIYFVIDSFKNTEWTSSEDRNTILEELKSNMNDRLLKYTSIVEYHTIDYDDPSKFDSILKPITGLVNVLKNRNQFYKNALVYFISIGLCDSKYLFHLDGNRGLYSSDKDVSFIHQGIELIEKNVDIFGVCVPRKNMLKKIIKRDQTTDYFRSHWNDNKYHMSLQAFLIDTQLFKDQTFEYIKDNRRNISKHTEYIMDFSYSDYYPIFINIKHSGVYKET